MQRLDILTDREFLIRNKISLFGSTIIFITLAVFLILRSGLEEKYFRYLFASSGFSLFLLFAPVLIYGFGKRHYSILKCEISIAMVLMALISLLRIVPGSQYLVIYAGFACFLTSIIVFFYSSTASIKLIVHLILAGAFAVWVAFTVLASASPTLYESLSVNRQYFQAQDLFFHSAIAQMIKYYGTPSTGLQGTPYIFYHTGSHYLFAEISRWLNIPVVRVYTIVYPLVCVPLFLKMFFGFAVQLQKSFSPRIGFSLLSIAFLFCVFMGIPPHLYSKGFVHTSILILESQVISMTFMFALLSMWLSRASVPMAYPLSLRNKLFILGVTPVLLWWIGYVKISTLFVLLGLFAFLVLRLKLLRTIVCLSLIITVVGSLFVYYATVETLPFGIRQMGAEGNVAFGSFYTVMIRAGLFKAFDWFFMFFLWTYFVAAIYIVSKFNGQIARKIGKKPLRLATESLMVVSIVGLLPSFLFSFHNANAAFFVSIQMFLAGGVLVALAPLIEDFVKRRKMLLGAYIASLVLIAIGTHFRLRYALKDVLLENLNTRILITDNRATPQKRFSLNREITRILHGFPDINVDIEKQPLYQAFKKLENLDTAENRSSTILVIEDYKGGNTIRGTERLNCLEKSLLIPALTGYAAANGALYNCSIETYGAHYYDYPGKTADFSVTTMCKEFAGKGFKTILTYEVESGRADKFSCN